MTTTTQLALNLAPLVKVAYARRMSLAERFAAFHSANPHVADALEALAAEWFDAGNSKVSGKALVEHLRWESGLRTSTDGGYQYDNSLTSRHVRLLIERHPEWADAFSLRTLKPEREAA